MNDGYCFVAGNCAACGVFITYNPDYVPSLRLNGVKQAICRACFHRWKEIHNSSVQLHPEAYEPQPESKLGDTSAQHDPRYTAVLNSTTETTEQTNDREDDE